MPKVKITITGERVHDVGYRLFLLEGADVLFIPNFDARNVKIDGKQVVIVLAEGDEAQIKEFTDFCRSNFPAEVPVGDVSVEGYDGKIRGIGSFRDSFSINQLSKIARTGVEMIGKQDAMLGKQTETVETIKVESQKTREELSSVIKDEGEKTRDTLTKHLGDA
ncbi:MAG: acylphosphatase [Candidatus Hydrothermarchaeaceae archaeon]